jgi:chemotaxis protein CheD
MGNAGSERLIERPGQREETKPVEQVVDIADFAVTNKIGTTLVTHSLGSCIGLTLWDPEVRVGGMIHYMLPESSISPEKAKSRPAMFADSGLPLLFRKAFELGASKKRLIVKVAGGASLLDDNGTFNIGKRNYVILRKLLWRNNVLIQAEDVGGSVSRTLRLEIATGRTTIRNRNGEVEL